MWETPLVRSYALSEASRADVYLKLENVQFTGSFKLRGAINALSLLARSSPGRNVLTVSAGNHGRAVALAAEIFDLAATIIVPRSAPRTKIEAIARHRVRLILRGENYDEAERHARELAATSDAVFISPYNDREVICGQGTVALEMLEAVPSLDIILVPVGGGGLLAGVALAAKSLNPKIAVYGVQSENSPAMYESLRAGRIVQIVEKESLADGLAGNIEPGSMTFPLVERYADGVILVSEHAIADAIRFLLEHEHLVVEGAGAVAVAALLSRAFERPGARIGVILSGSNIDLEQLLRVAAG
ncbi:MAG TPA: threonine/serine dehydratase [Blastocatellia bacterium]|nr:threonine/serine dehydratase [Blastocatellia bacterium]